MTRSLASLAFLLALAFALPAQAEDCATWEASTYIPVAKRYERGLLFRLEKCGQPDNYVFGTFHSDDPALYPLISHAYQAVLKMPSAGFELVIDGKLQEESRRMLMIGPGEKPLYERIPAGLYMQVRELAEKNTLIDEKQIDRYKPWAVAVLLQYPEPVGDAIVVDQRLQMLAQEEGRQVYGLETATEQFSIFNRLSESDQLELLSSSVTGIGEIQAETTMLQKFYVAEDLLGVASVGDESFDDLAGQNDTLSKYLEEELITKRNALMAKRLTSRLRYGTFVAVGALHLPGEEGLLALLEHQGYRVYPVEMEPQKLPAAPLSPALPEATGIEH